MDPIANTSEQVHMAKAKPYPAFLSLEGKVCVVVGGGRIAARKVRSLLTTGARIRVVSPLLHQNLQILLTEAAIEHIPAEYAVEHIVDASIVFAATNNRDVNRQVTQDAHERGIWINVADNPALSDFYVPAVVEREELTLAISTGGGAPAFARYVRELLEQALPEALGQALEMMVQARPLILTQAKEKQADLWESLLALRLEAIIESEGYETARKNFEAWLAQNIN